MTPRQRYRFLGFVVWPIGSVALMVASVHSAWFIIAFFAFSIVIVRFSAKIRCPGCGRRIGERGTRDSFKTPLILRTWIGRECERCGAEL
jgi:hypothetical protein